jgi:hypothetical protein
MDGGYEYLTILVASKIGNTSDKALVPSVMSVDERSGEKKKLKSLFQVTQRQIRISFHRIDLKLGFQLFYGFGFQSLANACQIECANVAEVLVPFNRSTPKIKWRQTKLINSTANDEECQFTLCLHEPNA